MSFPSAQDKDTYRTVVYTDEGAMNFGIIYGIGVLWGWRQISGLSTFLQFWDIEEADGPIAPALPFTSANGALVGDGPINPTYPNTFQNWNLGFKFNNGLWVTSSNVIDYYSALTTGSNVIFQVAYSIYKSV